MRLTKWFMVMLVFLTYAAVGYAESPEHQGLSKSLGITIESSDITIDVNNIEMFVTNSGVFAYDKTKSRGIYDGLYFPKGTDKTVIYDAGLWVGGKVNNDLRIAVGCYGQEWQPGTMKSIPGAFTGNWSDYYNDPKNPRYRVYKIRWDSHLELTRDDFATDEAYEAYQKARQDYLSWPVEDGAPVDAAGKPQLLGDMTLWTVFNDADPAIHIDDAGLTDPLGLEVQMTTFAFKRTGALGNIVFIKYLLSNKGPNTIDSTFVSLWADPDLGGAGDDLVGCDTELSLGYCYNATNNDNKYGSSPPAVGFDFFKGPIVRVVDEETGDTLEVELPMTSFNKYINGTDPRNKNDTWAYMKGLDAVVGGGAPYTDPITGQVTTYAVSGDPVTGTGWLDGNAGDRRYMLTSGPFTMVPGDVQEVVTAVVVGRGNDRLTSITALKFNDKFAQSAFDLNFELPSPPASPVIAVTPMDGKVILSWVDGSETQSGDYAFEGYNVYQGGSIAGPWKRVATYDVSNATGIIFDDQFDVETGVVIFKPAQYGSDSGVKRSIEIDEDAIRGGPLNNGTLYYFAVTAYSYDPEKTPKTLENSIEAIEVIPQRPMAGTAYFNAYGDTVTVVHTGGSDGLVVPLVVNPTQLTGHDYKVIFRDVEGETVWDLVDETAGTTLLADQTNQTGDDNYPFIDGLQVKVMGPPLSVKDWDYSDTRWFSWVNWGGSGFGGAVGLGYEFFGSTLTAADYCKVEIRFSSNPADWTNCKVYRRDQGYGVQPGLGAFPGSAWDMDSDPARRLNLAFVEMDTEEKPANLKWDPDNSDLGGREYLYVMNSDYDPVTAGGYDDEKAAIDADVLYAYWGRLRGSHPYLETEGTWTLYPNYVNTTNDVFAFTTTAPTEGDVKLAEKALDKILVVPNPYFCHSSYELNQFERMIKFTGLPEKCTIRIFNLAGDLIRTLEKDDTTTSILVWDVLTENDLPVASGIYIYHVKAPDIGTTFGKMAIFTEREQLLQY